MILLGGPDRPTTAVNKTEHWIWVNRGPLGRGERTNTRISEIA